MNTHIRPPFKIRVTGVTCVTTYTKRPDSLTLKPVTLMNDLQYTSCDADQTCNARTPHLLLADVGLGACRWIGLHDSGRGTESNNKGQDQWR